MSRRVDPLDILKQIKVETFPKPRKPEEDFIIATLRDQVLVTDCQDRFLFKAKFEDGRFQPSATAIAEIGDVHDELPDPAFMLFKACKAHYAKEIAGLKAQVQAQEAELKKLKRQLSLSTPIEASPTKAQAQAIAMKGKSLLNPRVKRTKTKSGGAGGLFGSDSDEAEDKQ